MCINIENLSFTLAENESDITYVIYDVISSFLLFDTFN